MLLADVRSEGTGWPLSPCLLRNPALAPPTLSSFHLVKAAALRKQMVQAALRRRIQVAAAWRQSGGTAGMVPSAWLKEPHLLTRGGRAVWVS